MDFLGSYRGGLLIISHDLELLDRSINKVLRLNEFTHKLEEYRGTYSHYITQTGDALALMERTQSAAGARDRPAAKDLGAPARLRRDPRAPAYRRGQARRRPGKSKPDLPPDQPPDED